MQKFGLRSIEFKRACQCEYKLAIEAEFLCDNTSARPLLADLIQQATIATLCLATSKKISQIGLFPKPRKVKLVRSLNAVVLSI